MNYWNQDVEQRHKTQPARDSERSPHTLDQEKSGLSGTAVAPIGVFDSGYGGLTVFRSIFKQLPEYDYIYIGDTARAPYGNR